MLSKLFSKEGRLLVNGVDDLVKATLEANENFMSQWGEGKTVHCSFTEMKRKVWAEYFISNTFTNHNYGSLKEISLICKVLEQLSQ